MAQNVMPTKEEAQNDTTAPERLHEGMSYAPRVDILETENDIVLYADMPGCKPEDINLEFENGQLQIFGRCQPRQEGTEYLLQEYGVGNYYRSFTINEQIDPNRISATYKQGVLTVQLAKSEAAKPKRISVKAE